VRELENVISSACITATGDFIDLADLPEQLQHRDARSVEVTIGNRFRSKRCKSALQRVLGCAMATG